jgi:hypothetical protein
VETCGGDRVTHQYINYRGFELTENFCHRGIKNSKIARLDQGRPSVGMHGEDPDFRGKSR